MATYFDATAPADKALLPPEQQSYTDLAALAVDVEQDVINEYTARAHYWFYTARLMASLEGTPEPVNTALSLYVYLRGYKVNSADVAVDVDLKNALKRTIAEMISWRISRRIRGETLASQSVQGVSRAYLAATAALWPKGWDRRLRHFDLREPCWGM